MMKLARIWLASTMAILALAGLVQAAPASAATGFTARTILEDSEDTTLADRATGKVDFRNRVTTQQLRIDVLIPKMKNQTVLVALDGASVASIRLDAGGRGRLQAVSGGAQATASAQLSTAMAALHMASSIGVTTGTGVLLLSGTLH